MEKVEGTMYFYAPEMCKEDADGEFEAFPLDIWALGVTLYCLVFLKLPFTPKENDYFSLIDSISYGDIEFPKEREISSGLKNLICKMLTKDPLQRVSSKELLKDNWLNEGKEKLWET